MLGTLYQISKQRVKKNQCSWHISYWRQPSGKLKTKEIIWTFVYSISSTWNPFRVQTFFQKHTGAEKREHGFFSYVLVLYYRTQEMLFPREGI